MEKIKKIFKKRPFLVTGSFFIILAVILYLIEGEETVYVSASYLLANLVFWVWFLIYLPIKFFINSKDEKIKKTKSFTGLLFWLLFAGTMVAMFIFMQKMNL